MIKNEGLLDRTVRHLMSEWGWPGSVFLLGGLLAFVVGLSTQWLDYKGVPNDYEQATALGVAAFGLAWILAAAAYYRVTGRSSRSSKQRRAR
jgi:hypothetical protein